MAEDTDIFLKMTIDERLEYIHTFDEMRAALELPSPSYERTLAVQNAERRVARVRKMMAAANLRPMPHAGGRDADG